MEVQFKEMPAFHMVGYPSLLRQSNAQEWIPMLWDKIIATQGEIKNQTNPPQCLGFEFFPFNFPETKLFYYMPSFTVNDLSEVPLMMCGKSIPAGLYAVFTHKGPTSTIAQTFETIYLEWLPNSDYEFRFGYDFELYDHRFKGMDESSELDIYVPVKKKG